MPKTSASGPFDFKTVFDRLHEQFPDKKILHLAYSAVTTASYHNALLEGEHRDYVTSIDTKHVSVGQAAVALHAAKLLREQPGISVEELAKQVLENAARTTSR